jgi:hypothetical protein
MRVSFADTDNGSSRNFQDGCSYRAFQITPSNPLSPPSILVNGSRHTKRESKVSTVSFAEDCREPEEEKAPKQLEGIICPNCLRLQEQAEDQKPLSDEDEELGEPDSDHRDKSASGSSTPESPDVGYAPIETEDTTLSANEGEYEDVDSPPSAESTNPDQANPTLEVHQSAVVENEVAGSQPAGELGLHHSENYE